MSLTTSVIMPCYNASRFIENAIESVINQSYSDIQLIVIDDGSADDTLSIVKRIKTRCNINFLILQQQNKGPYPARNLGLVHAEGEYVAFLDADDYWDTFFLEKMVGALKTTNADIAYCGWQNVGAGGPGSQPHIPPKYEENDIVKRFLQGCPWPIHAAIAKKSIIDAIGGFSERYFSSMDYDLWLRTTIATQNMVLVPEVLAYYRWHDAGQISSVKWKQTIDSWNIRNDYIRNNNKLISHIPKPELRRIVNGFLIENAYKAFWKRDLTSAQILFRKSLATGYYGIKDLKYLLPSILPLSWYKKLVEVADKKAAE